MPRIAVNLTSLLTAILFAVLAALAGYGSGSLLDKKLLYSGNVARSEQLVSDLVRRAEMAADYAYMTILDSTDLSKDGCSPTAEAAAESYLLTRGAVRAIGVIDEQTGTSCFVPKAFQPLLGTTALADMKFLPSRNKSVSISHAGELLLVIADRGEQRIIAATSLGTMLFDFLPGDIRDQAQAKVSLEGGDTVARFGGDFSATQSLTGFRQFGSSSERLPLVAEFAIPEKTLASWGKENSGQLAVSGALIGLLTAGFLAAVVLKPRTARDDLLEAITSGQITPYYQPIFSLDGGGLAGCEALVRWIKPDGSRIGPDRFIPLAEAEGLIAHLTMNLAIACAKDLGPLCRAWPKFKLSINMPPELLLTPEFISRLDAVFKEEGLPQSNVVFEVTERQSLQDASAVRTTIDAAQKMGFRFALDDTGVGHNGLANVQSLRVDFIKIDKCFIDMIDKSPESVSIVRMLVSLARDLSMKTVAEGIERVDQMNVLRDIGVDEGQGYLVAPALSPKAFVELAGNWFQLDIARAKPIKAAVDASEAAKRKAA